MRALIYERFENLYHSYHGYITTKALLSEGFTNRQILLFMQEGYLEKIANGYFWLTRSGLQKPSDYKAVEVGFINPNAVIAADSACFYQGLINVEPPRLSIVTRRTDRHQMHFPFTVTRHYLSESGYEQDKHTIHTAFGAYQIYDIDKSVGDCIRFQDDIDAHIFDLIIENYRKKGDDQRRTERLFSYAQRLKFADKVKGIL